MQIRLFAPLVLLLSLFSAPRAEERKLWWIFLETGKPTPPDSAAVTKMQMAHIANFKRLYGEGKLFTAGPVDDPSGQKRGIILVTAPSLDAIAGLFTLDPYVSNGHMKVNAAACEAILPIESQAVDPEKIEEVRIVLVHQTDAFRALSSDLREKAAARFESEVESFAQEASIGSWYRLESGDVWEVLHSRSLDSDSLAARFRSTDAGRDSLITVEVWPQWLAKGSVHVPTE